MIRLGVRSQLAERLRPWLATGLAGRPVVVETVAVASVPRSPGVDHLAGGSELIGVEAFLAGRRRSLSVATVGGERRLRVEGAGVFAIAADGSEISQIAVGGDPAAELEAAVGPVLVLALFRQGILCFHAASAARPDGRAVVFLGSSGVGKSTLASAAGERRLTDDLTPVDPLDRARVFPDFPQLKLTPPASTPGPPRSLAALILLAPPPVVGDAVRLEAVTSAPAVTALVAQTVASRLLTPSELDAHLAACATLAATVPVHRLIYPRQRDLLPEVWQVALSAC